MATQRTVAKVDGADGSAIVEATACRKPRRWLPATSPTARDLPAPSACPWSSTEIAIREKAGRCPARRVRRNLHSRTAGDGGVLESAGRDRKRSWLRRILQVGDIGVMVTQGAIRIVDRKKDMVLVSGFNVYPCEVEEVALHHPGVLEAAAIGVPDQTFGRSGEAVHRQQGPGTHRKRPAELSQGTAYPATNAEIHRVSAPICRSPRSANPAARAAAQELSASGEAAALRVAFLSRIKFVKENSELRPVLTLLAGMLLATAAHALSLADISGKDASGGLKEALTRVPPRELICWGGRRFSGQSKSENSFAGERAEVEGMMRGLGMGKQVDELITAMNRAGRKQQYRRQSLL